MHSQFQISIIVPCYNQSHYLDECLESILTQSYSLWECVIINDGSTDYTEQKAQEWVKKDNRFKYFKKDNGGLSSARNFGIEKALGEWILPLDADDKISEKYLELAVKEINRNPHLGLIYSDAEYFGSRKGKWDLPPYDFNQLLLANMIFCSAIFKKSDFYLVGGYDVQMKYGYEDWELWINILKNTKKEVVKLNYIGFYYRIKNKDSMVFEINSNQQKREYSLRYIVKKHYEQYIANEKLPNIIQQNHDNVLLKIENQYLRDKLRKIETNVIYKILHFIYTKIR